MLKIDLAKSFGRLEWSFLIIALRKQGFYDFFINLIYSCISNSLFSVIINGNLHGLFRGFRGIRQGCPLSPYLFVIAINELAAGLQEELHRRNLQGIVLGPNSPPIHSLMFADDLIICGQANQAEASTIWNTLQHFYALSGQTPNWAKSSVLFSKNVNNTQKDIK